MKLPKYNLIKGTKIIISNRVFEVTGVCWKGDVRHEYEILEHTEKGVSAKEKVEASRIDNSDYTMWVK